MSATPPDIAGSVSQQQWAKSTDWELHREKITQLYRDQGMHLNEVIAVMARDHSFYAK